MHASENAVAGTDSSPAVYHCSPGRNAMPTPKASASTNVHHTRPNSAARVRCRNTIEAHWNASRMASPKWKSGALRRSTT